MDIGDPASGSTGAAETDQSLTTGYLSLVIGARCRLNVGRASATLAQRRADISLGDDPGMR